MRRMRLRRMRKKENEEDWDKKCDAVERRPTTAVRPQPQLRRLGQTRPATSALPLQARPLPVRHLPQLSHPAAFLSSAASSRAFSPVAARVVALLVL